MGVNVTPLGAFTPSKLLHSNSTFSHNRPSGLCRGKQSPRLGDVISPKSAERRTGGPGSADAVVKGAEIAHSAWPAGSVQLRQGRAASSSWKYAQHRGWLSAMASWGGGTSWGGAWGTCDGGCVMGNEQEGVGLGGYGGGGGTRLDIQAYLILTLHLWLVFF